MLKVDDVALDSSNQLLLLPLMNVATTALLLGARRITTNHGIHWQTICHYNQFQ